MLPFQWTAKLEIVDCFDVHQRWFLTRTPQKETHERGVGATKSESAVRMPSTGRTELAQSQIAGWSVEGRHRWVTFPKIFC